MTSYKRTCSATLALALMLVAAPVVAFEHIRGGFVCYPGARAGVGEFSACQAIAAREAQGRVVLDGWYKSAGAFNTPAFTTLSGAELIARFGVPACGDRRAEARR